MDDERLASTTPLASPAPAALPGFRCAHYEPVPGHKRCKDYQDGGTCARDDTFLCEEWQRRNRPSLPIVPAGRHAGIPGVQVPEAAAASPSAASPPGSAIERPRLSTMAEDVSPPPLPRDLFGNLTPERHQISATKKSRATVVPVAPAPAPGPPAPVSAEPEALAGLTPEDIDSFRGAGLEVLVDTPTCGEVWLVGKYTEQPRQELLVEHAATIARVLSIFPGARVLGVQKTKVG